MLKNSRYLLDTMSQAGNTAFTVIMIIIVIIGFCCWINTYCGNRLSNKNNGVNSIDSTAHSTLHSNKNKSKVIPLEISPQQKTDIV